mmetsp:Transcript_16256/g.39699  ORF Transcript_16256/g.39699 Transcript_16256/m.39699 type:complete len:212 (-) Transcript_16256:167-802(-)
MVVIEVFACTLVGFFKVWQVIQITIVIIAVVVTSHTWHTTHTWHSTHASHVTHSRHSSSTTHGSHITHLLHQSLHVHTAGHSWHAATAHSRHTTHSRHTAHAWWHTAHTTHTWWHTAHSHSTFQVGHVKASFFSFFVFINITIPVNLDLILLQCLILQQTRPEFFLFLVFFENVHLNGAWQDLVGGTFRVDWFQKLNVDLVFLILTLSIKL